MNTATQKLGDFQPLSKAAMMLNDNFAKNAGVPASVMMLKN